MAMLDRNHEFEPDMKYRAAFSDRILPIALSLTGLCVAVMSVILLIHAAKLGLFMRLMLGLMGVILVDSLLLSFVAIRIAVGTGNEATAGEKVVLLGLSLFTGIGMMIN